MPSVAILVDFGSTFTKVLAVDLERVEVLGRSQAPSTVDSDVREGLVEALKKLPVGRIFDGPPKDLDALERKIVFASSSAAGGLRIGVVGHVPGLTVEAASQAALGAGAKIVGSTSFKLNDAKLFELQNLRPDIILLTGGVDGGDRGTILHNARVLADSRISVPIIVGGNFVAAPEVAGTLRHAGKEARVVANVMPRAGELAVEAAREEIRALFMERITAAKGLDRLKEYVPVVLPTPMAVLEGLKLAAAGTAGAKGWGDILVVDVGGATTDVHSIGHGIPAGENVIARGLAEPYAKRTVEGDLGIRFNASTILARVGVDRLAGALQRDFPAHAPNARHLCAYVEHISRDVGTTPEEPWHAAADAALARAAVDLAIARHVGRRERILAHGGEAWVHWGKDLRDVRTLIGTGGVFVHNPFAAYILSHSAGREDRVQVLRPRRPRLFFDSSYLLYAVGLLADMHAAAALQIFQKYVRSADDAQNGGRGA